MNNSAVSSEGSSDEPKDPLLKLRERDSVLIRLIEAIEDINATSAWRTLKEEELDGELAKLHRLLLTESKKKDVNLPEVYRLQGRIESVKKYSLDELLTSYLTEHDNIKKKL